MTLHRVDAIGRRIEHFVDDVVAGADEAHRRHADDDTNHHSARDVAGAVAEGRQDAGEHEHLLDPVVDAHDRDVPTDRGPRGGRGKVGRRRHVGSNIIVISRRVLVVW